MFFKEGCRNNVVSAIWIWGTEILFRMEMGDITFFLEGGQYFLCGAKSKEARNFPTLRLFVTIVTRQDRFRFLKVLFIM